MVGFLDLVRSLRHARQIYIGFDPSSVVVMSLNPSLQGYDETRGVAFYDRVLERVRRLPGVRAASFADSVPLGLGVAGANRHDVKLTRETIESMAVERPEPTPEAPQGRCLDKGEDDDAGRALLDECGCTAHIRARGEAAQALKQEAGFKAHRWVVERTQSWRNRFRRVLIRWDKKVRNDLGFLPLACA